MTTTDTDALTERLWEAIAEARDKGERTARDVDSYEVVAAVLPIIRKAQADAWKAGRLAGLSSAIDRTAPVVTLWDNPYRTEEAR